VSAPKPRAAMLNKAMLNKAMLNKAMLNNRPADNEPGVPERERPEPLVGTDPIRPWRALPPVSVPRYRLREAPTGCPRPSRASQAVAFAAHRPGAWPAWPGPDPASRRRGRGSRHPRARKPRTGQDAWRRDPRPPRHRARSRHPAPRRNARPRRPATSRRPDTHTAAPQPRAISVTVLSPRPLPRAERQAEPVSSARAVRGLGATEQDSGPRSADHPSRE
jgi:hypothetical protein